MTVLHPKSITSRLISLHVIAIGITSICMPLALYWLLNSAATDLHHRSLRENADTIAQYLSPEPGGGLKLELPSGLQALYSESYGRYAYAVLDGTGRVLFSSLANHGPVFAADSRRPHPSFLETRRGEAVLYGASIPKQIADRTVWIEVAQDLAHRDVLIDDIVSDFFQRVGWITLPILLSLLVIDVAIFRRALRPVLEASQRAKKIGPARTDVRLPVAGLPTEIQPLVAAVNEALDRLERGFQIQREFTADAAHELRTPLAILRTRIDTLADQTVADALRRDVAGMGRILSQLLDSAELDTFVVNPTEVADLKSVCAEVAEFIAPLALAQGKELALSAPEAPVWIAGHGETLSRAIRNLAENAINHTPAGTTAEIVVSADGSVCVLDQGPGIAVEERELVFRRFWRRDRRRAGGAGLGLAIVARIVEAHAGTITINNRACGGAEVCLSFRRLDGGASPPAPKATSSADFASRELEAR